MKSKHLDPMAIARANQARLERAAAETEPEECSRCGGTLFVPGHEIRIVSKISLGSDKDVICRHGNRHVCAGCGKEWIKEKEGGNGQDKAARGEGPKGGTDTPEGNGGLIVT